MMTWDEVSVRLLLHGYRNVLRPILFRYDPEDIHDLTIRVLGNLPDPVLELASWVIGAPEQPVTVAGVRFPGRVGVGAGLDKDGSAARAWSALGFGFAELGTVTAQGQPGNPKPRSFRLRTSHGIINRMGFNNPGAAALAGTLAGMGVLRGTNALGCPLGISIGKTKITPLSQAVDDYLISLEAVAPYADYVAINVSSPNTPGLRNLQDRQTLADLTAALVDRAGELDPVDPIPLFVKVSPDLGEAQLAEIIEVSEESGVAGLIATNTTIERQRIHPSERHQASQAGGLSGAPLTKRALETVEAITARTDLPVMGVGGIMKPVHAQAMFDAGAQLVQIYTGFIFKGPALVRGINKLTVADAG